MHFAVTGCGSMGLRYVHALAQMRAAGFTGLHLGALCDADEAKACELAAYAVAHGLPEPRVEVEIAQLLEDPALEAVAVVVPTLLHHEIAARALRAGKHVLIEKPMTISLKAAGLLDESRAAGLVLAVAENFRRIPSNRAFGAMVVQGAFGTPRHMEMRRAASPDESYMIGKRQVRGARWYHDPSQSGSYHVFELGAHEIDLQTFWFGPVAALRADAHSGADGLTQTSIALHFVSGMRSEIVFQDSATSEETVIRRFQGSNGDAFSKTWSAWQDGEIRIKGQPALDPGVMTARYLGGLSPQERARHYPPGSLSDNPTAGPSDPLSYGVGAVLADFATAVRTGGAPEIGFIEGCNVVAICEAIMASIAAGGAEIRPGQDAQAQSAKSTCKETGA